MGEDMRVVCFGVLWYVRMKWVVVFGDEMR